MYLSFIGSGNVSTHLAWVFQKAGHSILSVYSKNDLHAKALCRKINHSWVTKNSFVSSQTKRRCICARNINQIHPDTEIIFICVTDNAVDDILAHLSVNPLTALVHTSGSLPIHIFSKFSNPYGVFYPLQTITKGIPVDFTKVPVLIESPDRNLLKKLKILAKGIGGSATVVNSETRALIHLSAVFASNFTNHLLTLASTLLKKNKLNFKILHLLINETIRKALLYGPQKVQTGPAKRHDLKIIQQHLKLLKKEPELKKLYEKLSKSIMKF